MMIPKNDLDCFKNLQQCLIWNKTCRIHTTITSINACSKNFKQWLPNKSICMHNAQSYWKSPQNDKILKKILLQIPCLLWKPLGTTSMQIITFFTIQIFTRWKMEDTWDESLQEYTQLPWNQGLKNLRKNHLV